MIRSIDGVARPAQATQFDNPAGGNAGSLSPSAAQAVSLPADAGLGAGGGVDPWYKRLLRLNRWVYVGAGASMLALAGITFAVISLNNRPQPVASVAKPTATTAPTPAHTPLPLYYPLTGLPATSADAVNQPVVGVMVENLYPDARPQSGLGSAGVVYEALAEGGITRFLAVFQEPLPGSIGPVRSLRPYYLDWGLEYDLPLAHAGGSEPAMAQIKPSGLKDINALAYDGSSFVRTRDRYAPHNLYTTSDLLSKLVAKLGFAQAPTFTPLPRKADTPPATPAHTIISVGFSTAAYAVKYTYNAAGNAYARVMGGTAHIDRNTNQQIQVKNIVVQFVPVTYGTQSNGKPETDYHLIGSGKALVFRDGDVIVGTWNKSSDKAPTKILDGAGQPVEFNRGSTWYEVVPTTSAVTY